MFKSIFKAVAVSAVAAFFCVGCGDKSDDGPDDGGKPSVTKGTFTDSRDGTVYNTIEIGTQTWFAENLNYNTDGSKCYGEDGTIIKGMSNYKPTSSEVQANCAKYGRLYDWDAAMRACPSGWHLPDDDEWTTLVDYAGDDKSPAGTKLKSKTGWDDDDDGRRVNGTDDYGFSALPGGECSLNDYFSDAGTNGNWWSATGYYDYDDRARKWEMLYLYVTVGHSNEYKGMKLSVRCVLGESKVTPPGTSYTITFNANGGTISPTFGKTGDDGKLDSLPTPTRSGYTFDGWYTAATGGTTVTISNVYSANTTIYARWTSESVTPPSGNAFTDSRDGKTYKKIVIGTQTWMGENLNYNAAGSVCYENKTDNCAKYGRLYNWATAMDGASSSDKVPSGVRGVCPTGWHLPSDAEWTALVNYVGSPANTKLKSTTGWYGQYGDCNTSTDEYEFSALPGGFGLGGGSFSYPGDYGYWWSATESTAERAWARILRCREMVGDSVRTGGNKTSVFSVRCVAD
jgi:uncharacterized protein (TIGR02145 family)/uncharacterized repeat protein (TIGR02543 family)